MNKDTSETMTFVKIGLRKAYLLASQFYYSCMRVVYLWKKLDQNWIGVP